jgi:hypothetical protein
MDVEKKRNWLFILFCIPVFIVVAIYVAIWSDAREYDFAAYWQASFMIKNGGNIYSPDEWLSVREEQQTALHSEVVFQYPLPLAVLLLPLSFVDVKIAYGIWIVLCQIFIIISVLFLLRAQKKFLPLYEILIVASLFLFRPTYHIIVRSGQILAMLLFFAVIATFLFYRKKWFLGGIFLSFFSLKPSIGLPILIIFVTWLLIRKYWYAIYGICVGCLLLFFGGAIYDPSWLLKYITSGQHLLMKYWGHPTIWGLANLMFENTGFVAMFAFMIVGFVLSSILVLFISKKPDNPFAIMSLSVSAGLLLAPYSWSYDQILLIISLMFVVIEISKRYGDNLSLFFLMVFVLFSASFVFLAFQLGHDVFSVFVTVTLWGLTIFLITKGKSVSFARNDVANISDE